MLGERVEERIDFDEETRRSVLKKTKFKCACCGDKLDMVKHTIDHVIPISRGGTNDIDNLIGLCKICNKYKDNLIYFPGDYYTYLASTDMSLTNKMHDYVVKNLRGMVGSFNVKRYPIISPCSTVRWFPNGVKVKGYNRQLLFDIVYMNSHMQRGYTTKVNFLKNYAYYAVIKRTTQSTVAIVRIDYGEYDSAEGKIHQITIFDEWTICNPLMIAQLMRNIAEVIACRYSKLGIPLDEACIASLTEKVPLMVYNYCSTHSFAWDGKPIDISAGTGLLHDREEYGPINYFGVKPSDEEV